MLKLHLILHNVFNIKPDSFGSRASRLGFLAIVFFVLHIVAMIYFEGMKISDAVWVTFTTATTVGYGDLSASTPMGRASTVLLMYLVGLWVFAEVIGLFMERREFVGESKRKGIWSWKMNGHIVIINTPDFNGDLYLERLVSEFRADDDYKQLKIVVVSHKLQDGLPLELRSNGVVLVCGDPTDVGVFDKACVSTAKYVVVVSDKSDSPKSDAYTLDAVYRSRKVNKDAFIAAECVIDENRDGIFDNGANAIIRPIRSYPGLIVRAIDSIGSEKIFEDLFSSDHAKIDNTKDASHLKSEIGSLTWKEIVIQTVENRGFVPLGLRMDDGEVAFSPDMDENFSIEKIAGVFIISNE